MPSIYYNLYGQSRKSTYIRRAFCYKLIKETENALCQKIILLVYYYVLLLECIPKEAIK